MEDENRLELRLGLPWCHSPVKFKEKNDNSSDTSTDEDDRSSKLINNFIHFLDDGSRKQESGTGSQIIDPAKPGDSFCNNFYSNAVDVDASKNLNDRGLWVANGNMGAKVEEGKSKQNICSNETSNQKKREREAHNADSHGKPKPSHISLTTDEGSTADDGVKKYFGVASPSKFSKEIHRVIDPSVVDLQGQNRPYHIPFMAQSVNIINVPYSPLGVPSTSGYPLPRMVQVTAAANSERSGTQSVMPGNLPVMFGHSPVQQAGQDNSQCLASHPQQLHPSYVGRLAPNSDKHNDGLKISQAATAAIPHKPSEASQCTGRASEQAKCDGKQHATDGGSSSQTKDAVEQSNMTFGAKEQPQKPRAEGFHSEFSAIRPGIAADQLKFGGCGSYPDLPWVSTKDPGPNGKTISGVTYRYGANQIKIVCACHGSHMSPEEFVRHKSEEQIKPDSGSGLALLPSCNTAASAQS